MSSVNLEVQVQFALRKVFKKTKEIKAFSTV